MLKQVFKLFCLYSSYLNYFHFLLISFWNLDSRIWVEAIILLKYLKSSSNLGFYYGNISQILGIFFYFRFYQIQSQQCYVHLLLIHQES